MITKVVIAIGILVVIASIVWGCVSLLLAVSGAFILMLLPVFLVALWVVAALTAIGWQLVVGSE